MSAPPTGQGEPIEDRRQLVEFIAAGSKPEADWRIGTEHEKFGFCRDSLAP
jgi:glutamate--cysteine ligase